MGHSLAADVQSGHRQGNHFHLDAEAGALLFFLNQLFDVPAVFAVKGDEVFIFVRDAVAATIAAANRGEPGSVYNIGGGARVSVNQVLDLMAACTGMQPRIQRSPAQKGDMRDTYADTTAARESLGFRPIVPLEAGLEEEYRWISNAVTHV